MGDTSTGKTTGCWRGERRSRLHLKAPLGASDLEPAPRHARLQHEGSGGGAEGSAARPGLARSGQWRGGEALACRPAPAPQRGVLLPSALSKTKQTFLRSCRCSCKFSRRRQGPPGAFPARARQLSQVVGIPSAQRLPPKLRLLLLPIPFPRLLLGDGVGLHISKLPWGEKEGGRGGRGEQV